MFRWKTSSCTVVAFSARGCCMRQLSHAGDEWSLVVTLTSILSQAHSFALTLILSQRERKQTQTAHMILFPSPAGRDGHRARLSWESGSEAVPA